MTPFCCQPMLSFTLQALTLLFHLGSQATKIRPRCRAHRSSTSIVIQNYESYPCCRRLLPSSESTANYGSLHQISAVKEKIAAEKGWEPKTQKLIYSGLIYPGFAPLRCAGSDLIQAKS
jgi:hypothetical protein